MDPATVTLDDALRVLALPRVVGVDPGTGEEIVASNGRYGPYLRRGAESRSLERRSSSSPSVSMRRWRCSPSPRPGGGGERPPRPCGSSGADPDSGGAIVLREGRFGPYVTDGTTNASLRKGDTVEGITPERAVELLADRRAAGPRPPRARRAGGRRRRRPAPPRRRRHRQEGHRRQKRGDAPGRRPRPRRPGQVVGDPKKAGPRVRPGAAQSTATLAPSRPVRRPVTKSSRATKKRAGGLTVRGRLIVLEGGEATGKSTQAARLAAGLGRGAHPGAGRDRVPANASGPSSSIPTCRSWAAGRKPSCCWRRGPSTSPR